MKINKTLKIAAFLVATLLVLALLFSVGINYFINKKLPDIIAEKNDTAYDLVYENVHFSLFNNTLSIENVSLNPKKNSNITQDIDFMGNVNRINVSGVNFYDLIKNKNLKAYTISIIQPDITLFQSIKKDTLKNTSNNFLSTVDIDKIKVENAQIKMLNAAGDSLLHEVFNFNTEVDGIHMGNYTVDKKIPFTYTDYSFKIDSIYSVINDLQVVKSGAININPKHIEIEGLRLLPTITSEEFVEYQDDSYARLTAEIPHLLLQNTDWGFDNEDNLYVKIAEIAIDSANLRILNQNQTAAPKERLETKAIKSIIPFRLDVDQVQIENASFNSLEQLDIQKANIKLKSISNRVGEQLLVKEIQLNQPEFTQIPTKKPKNSRKKSQLNDLILIDKFLVNNARYILKNKAGKSNKLMVEDVNFKMNSLRIDQQTLSENLPFTYDNLHISTKKIHLHAGNVYDIFSDGLESDGLKAIVKRLKVSPKISRRQHANQLKFAEDYYDIEVPSLELNAIKWGFDRQNDLYVNLGEVVLNQMNASIYRDVSIPRNPKENNLYSHRLRNLEFPFEIKSLKIKNSKLTYEEDTKNSTEPGKLSFTNFNLNVTDLYSGYKRTNGPKTQIMIQTKFMKQGDLKTSWQFDIMDRNEKFNINGTLTNFPAPAMNPFLKPYLQVSTEGNIDEMIFNFSGNNDRANGAYAMDFSDLKVRILDNEKQEMRLISAAANVVMRNNTEGLKKVEIKTVERKKDASFFNFLWLCIMQGLKQTVI